MKLAGLWAQWIIGYRARRINARAGILLARVDRYITKGVR